MKVKTVYCIGLGGVGVSAMAKYFLAQGARVSGSDPQPSPLVDDVIKLGGRHFLDPDPQRLTAAIDVVIYSDACPVNHPELETARRLNLPVMSFAETLAAVMQPYAQRLAITGTNGKSTTTALTGLIFISAGLDPTVFVGSRVTTFNGNLRLGQSDYFIAEADEYRDHFLALQPNVVTITNIELDHLDYFKDLSQIIDSFQRLLTQLPATGKIIANVDDPVINQHWGQDRRLIGYGFNQSATARIVDYKSQAGQQIFYILWRQQRLGPYRLHVPGKFNALNAAAAITTALSTGISPTLIPPVIESYRGIWRRFEILTAGPVTVVSDYAHHPTAISGTIQGTREFFPGRRVIAVFQPHHHHRLTRLFDNFTSAFDQADLSIITDVYAVLGREQVTDSRTSRELVEAIVAHGRRARYAPDLNSVQTILTQQVRAGDVVLIMGAGDIWKISNAVAKKYD